MRLRLIAVSLMLVSAASVADAHRLDELLQATMISVGKDQVSASMRLIPGIAVSSAIIAAIDINGDGVISATEQQAYAARVLGDLSLTIDGIEMAPTLVSAKFPSIELMKQGLGEIHIEFTAALPPGALHRRLVLENRHRYVNAVYLVNCLVPADKDIRIVSQTRNEEQSFYQLDYEQAGSSASLGLWSRLGTWSRTISPAVLGAEFYRPNLFRLGIRHIAEGTDHLLFLLALLLPAPLVALGARWSGPADIRQSLVRILGIVTAFTIGHSITLGIAAMTSIHVPSRPVEVLIAVSILISAIHALRPIFPGREAAIAAFFGLIHGLAFAATLTDLGLGRWERLAGIFAFNLGIESMQLIVVAVTIPSLILMSRTKAYSSLRIVGASFTGGAAVCWIAERSFDLHTPVDTLMNGLARHAVLLAATLFVTSVACWITPGLRNSAGADTSGDGAVTFRQRTIATTAN